MNQMDLQHQPLSSKSIKGLVVAGTHSGAGKTTITLGLLAALTRRGYTVASYKVGPDFIDPGHHCQITGVPSRNLDGWMLSKSYNIQTFSKSIFHCQADIAVVEGVMGLFDGYDGRSEAGSTAQMAKWTGLPVVLVVNAKSMARSAAALVQGFEGFDPDLTFAGVIFNHVGSPRHLDFLNQAMQDHVRMPVLGGIPRESAITMPERHLGLVTQEDNPFSTERIQALADLIETHVDVSGLVQELPMIAVQTPEPNGMKNPVSHRPRIGIARDNAFCFYYPDNLDLLVEAGAQLVFFSPITDTNLPKNLHGIYFGGGYPELHAKALAQNTSLKHQIRQCSANGMPIYAECGGFIYLCQAIIDLDGHTHPMVECFPFTARMLPRLKSLGYREITLNADTIIGSRGWQIRGHEFHYSEINDAQVGFPTRYQVTDRNGVQTPSEGYQVANTLGSYFHLHFGSCPKAVESFVDHCRAYKKKETDKLSGRLPMDLV